MAVGPAFLRIVIIPATIRIFYLFAIAPFWLSPSHAFDLILVIGKKTKCQKLISNDIRMRQDSSFSTTNLSKTFFSMAAPPSIGGRFLRSFVQEQAGWTLLFVLSHVLFWTYG